MAFFATQGENIYKVVLVVSFKGNKSHIDFLPYPDSGALFIMDPEQEM